jgi:hypothetical protein
MYTGWGFPTCPTKGSATLHPLGLTNNQIDTSLWRHHIFSSLSETREVKYQKNGLPRHYLRSNLGPCIKQVGTQKARNSKCVPMSRMLYKKSKFWRDRRLRSQNSVQIVPYFRYYPLSQCWIPCYVAHLLMLFQNE